MQINRKSPITHRIYRADTKAKISYSQKQIRSTIKTIEASIIHRTQAINNKRSYQTFEEEQTVRQNE